MKKTVRISLLVVVCFSLGLSTVSLAQRQKTRPGQLPSWVKDPSSIYNTNEYLMAVGSGSNLQDAQNKALGSLTKLFQSKVKVNQKLIDDYRETSRNDKITTDRVTQLLSVTEAGSRQNLMNAKVLKKYTAIDGTSYVLVGMKRQETATLYSSEISRNERLLNNYEQQINRENNLLQRLALIKKALILLSVNDNLKTQRDILLGKKTGGMNKNVKARLEREYQNLRRRSLIYVTGKNVPNVIKISIGKVLKNEGFTVSPIANKAIIHAVVYYTYKDMDLKRKDAHFIHWSLNIQMIDVESGKKLKEFSMEGRDGGLSEQGALSRSEHTIDEKLHHEFKSFIQQELLSIN
ncbi:MAG TPA: LPP20 family lipoprotein [Balneolales bacterium]|nr:LPP20 family lipoprotein [Balneolales bacterium]